MQYNQPPLPFMGNKRNMLKYIKAVLETMQEDGQIDSETIFIDCFGGSGLVSHNIKQWYPSNRVVWNDYDNYQERLNHLDTTEQLRQEMAKIIKLNTIYNIYQDNIYQDKLHPHTKEKILTLLQDKAQSGAFIDYITISVYLLFSGTYTKTYQELAKHTFYNRLASKPLNKEGYLAGVERTQADFIDLLESYKDITNKCLILDPPYLQTQKGNYKDSFQLAQFFTLIERVQKPYIFFGSYRSDILPCFAYLSKYHKELANYTYKQAKLTLNDTDYIIYPHPRSLFT